MEICRLCSQELIVELDDDSFDEATSSAVGAPHSAPDDLLLACGCHYHWQCLLDDSPKIVESMKCPTCESSITSTLPGPSSPLHSQVITTYHNEGGLQENLDIRPLIIEEAYLDANPAARPARALLTMCGEGDVPGIVELLAAITEDPDEGDMSPADLLRYQDPLDDMKTGLHIAVEKAQQEVVWLLLWLASELQTHNFPDEVIAAANELKAQRGAAPGIDIRSIRDEQNRTAEDIANTMGPEWGGLLFAGILKG